jgi:hypothetical protein
MGEDRGYGHEVNEDVKSTDRVTITEAATLLGVHPNTVRSRVKAGIYDAEKVFTENGFTWMIDRDSLINPPLPKDSQQGKAYPSQIVNPGVATPMDLVQDLLRPFVEDLGRVREELGAERVRREQAERERDDLAAKLHVLTASRDELHDPETVAEATTGTGTPSGQADRETGVQRRSWWRRFFGFNDRGSG